MTKQPTKKVDYFEFRAAMLLVDPDVTIRHGNKWMYAVPKRDGPVPTTAMYDRYRTVLEAFDLPVFPEDPAAGYLVYTNLDRFTPWGNGNVSRWEGYGITRNIRLAQHYMLVAEVGSSRMQGRRRTRRRKT